MSIVFFLFKIVTNLGKNKSSVLENPKQNSVQSPQV